MKTGPLKLKSKAAFTEENPSIVSHEVITFERKGVRRLSLKKVVHRLEPPNFTFVLQPPVKDRESLH